MKEIRQNVDNCRIQILGIWVFTILSIVLYVLKSHFKRLWEEASQEKGCRAGQEWGKKKLRIALRWGQEGVVRISQGEWWLSWGSIALMCKEVSQYVSQKFSSPTVTPSQLDHPLSNWTSKTEWFYHICISWWGVPPPSDQRFLQGGLSPPHNTRSLL